jgi:hypothetical protein
VREVTASRVSAVYLKGVVMIAALDKQEAIKRMTRRGTQKVSWTLPGIEVEWSYIPATAVRNYDGTPAGSGNDPSRVVLQQVVYRECGAEDAKNGTSYTNHW